MRLNLRIASRSGLSLLTVGGRERDGFVERFMFLAFKNEQASERTFPRERESRAGWKRWKQRSKKLINFFLFFFLNKKRKTVPPLPPSAAFLLSFFSGSTFFGCGWMVSCWLFTAEPMLWVLHLANPCSAAHPNTADGCCDQSWLAEEVLFQSRGKALHVSGQ